MNVATALTACGIETVDDLIKFSAELNGKLQQRLPLAVLKQQHRDTTGKMALSCNSAYRLRY